MAQASAEKLEHTGPDEKERVASVLQRAVGKNAEAVFAKGKWNRAICPEYQVMKRVKVGESRTFVSERGIRAGA